MKLCECGCGEPSPVAYYTNQKRGYYRGQQTRFISGHNPAGRKHRTLDQLWEVMLTKRVLSTNGCWNWTGAQDLDGYGLTCYVRMVRVNRITAHMRLGLDLKDRTKVVCHACDNPMCFNPDHLFVGTQVDNLHDAMRKGRHHGNRRLVKAG